MFGRRRRAPLRDILEPVSRSFGQTIRKYGAMNKGVGWSSPERQQHRFRILAGLFADERSDHLVINDLGCGYGAMFEAYADLPQLERGRYFGYDISREMLAQANSRIRDKRASFILSHEATRDADYSFVSGSYNIKMYAGDGEWLEFVLDNLTQLWSRTHTGLAFNMMSIHAPEKHRTLYYADPGIFLAFCQRVLSPDSRLFDGYDDREWTIFVRRQRLGD